MRSYLSPFYGRTVKLPTFVCKIAASREIMGGPPPESRDNKRRRQLSECFQSMLELRRTCTPITRTRVQGSPLNPHQSPALAIPASFFLGLALVMEFLAATERDVDLGTALLVEEQA